MPLYGHELTTALTPFDAGLGRVVKFEKARGDFVGRERAGGRRRARRGPTRRASWSAWSPRAAGCRAPGTPVVGADGAVIGEVTSGAPSPRWASRSPWRTWTPRTPRPARAGVGVDIRGTPRAVRGRGAAVLQAAALRR